MDKILRILFILVLFGILMMQVLFLLSDKITERNKSFKPEVEAIMRETTVQDTIPNEKNMVGDAKSATETKKSVSKGILASPEPAQKTDKYTVKPDRCISCNLCVINCPVGAITMEGGVAVIDEEKCIGCGICKDGDESNFAGCPVDAISKK